MTIDELLEIDGARFIEPYFSELPKDEYHESLITWPCEDTRLLIDQEENLLAFAINDNDSWIVTSLALRGPCPKILERFEEIGGEILEEEALVWNKAVTEYFSNELLVFSEPAIEDVNPERIPVVSDLLHEVWGSGNNKSALDCCCGSGIGTLVMRQSGYEVTSFDNDQYLLASGLSRGRLNKDNTSWIDARIAGLYGIKSEIGLGLMFGEIYSFNFDLWKEIIEELITISGDTLITVGSENEAKMIKSGIKSKDRTIEIWENNRDPIYDRFVIRIN